VTTTLLACALTAVIAYSAGWCHGHRTARIRHVVIPTGCSCTDQAAIAEAEDTFLDGFRRESSPDDPGSSAA
jgi:hypothetical protein